MRLKRTTDSSETTDEVKNWFDDGAYEERARREAERRTSALKHRVGRTAFDVLEEQFPEEARARRRKDGAALFVAGVAIGLLVHYLLDRS